MSCLLVLMIVTTPAFHESTPEGLSLLCNTLNYHCYTLILKAQLHFLDVRADHNQQIKSDSQMPKRAELGFSKTIHAPKYNGTLQYYFFLKSLPFIFTLSLRLDLFHCQARLLGGIASTSMSDHLQCQAFITYTGFSVREVSTSMANTNSPMIVEGPTVCWL